MNLKLCRTKIIQLINQYSINGLVTDSQKNSDYLLRINNLIDTAQKELSNKKEIYKTQSYQQTANYNATDYAKYDLPANFKKELSVRLRKYPDSTDIEYLIENNQLLVDPNLDGTIVLAYSKYPETINDDSSEFAELEIAVDAQEAIPYYVGGHIFLEDNPSTATMLLNEYEVKKAALINIVPTQQVKIQDSFSWGW